ncbi:MAG: HPF/RaiA family ribosome-associated protein [Rhodopirellula sp.]|nr:HPF/RaiA family ribosome-associated protein [Rhodopirellula sp.]
MRLVIRPRKFNLHEGLRESLEMRVRFALSRFSPRIRDVLVTLEDVNGPRGGVDKRCQVVVSLTPRGRVSIDETEDSFETAIAHAAERAGRAVGRELERRQTTRASGPGMSPRSD